MHLRANWIRPRVQTLSWPPSAILVNPISRDPSAGGSLVYGAAAVAIGFVALAVPVFLLTQPPPRTTSSAATAGQAQPRRGLRRIAASASCRTGPVRFGGAAAAPPTAPIRSDVLGCQRRQSARRRHGAVPTDRLQPSPRLTGRRRRPARHSPPAPPSPPRVGVAATAERRRRPRRLCTASASARPPRPGPSDGDLRRSTSRTARSRAHRRRQRARRTAARAAVHGA